MTATTDVEMSKAQGGSPQDKTAAAPSPDKVVASSSPAKAVGEGAGSEKHKEAMSLFVAGKRDLIVKDLESAVENFAKSCELLSSVFGDTAYECADAYYYYGKALLDLARMESGVFGNALDGVPEGEDANNSQVEDPEKMTEEERDNVEKEVGDALDENFKAMTEKQETREKRINSTEGEDEEEDSEESEESEENKEEKKEALEKEEAGPSKDSEPSKTAETKDKEDTESLGDNAKEGEDKKAQEIEDEEEPSNLQLAWEMLELAKVAFTTKLKDIKKEDKKALEMKICETLLLLGEVSLENETYEQAVQDITECLNKRKELHPADSRRIAETQYQLGVALGHFEKFDEAIKSLNEAIACLKLRMENLKNKTSSVDETKADDAFYTRETEITELESLIPEIEEKIQDTKDMQKQGKEQTENGFKNGDSSSSSAKPISTISVKRKAEGVEEASPKKAHLANGSAK